MKYIAFLRGINVGGKSKVSMEDLRDLFATLGFTDIKTFLNSGNIMFTADSVNDLQTKIEDALQKKFDRRIPVILRTTDALKKLVDSDPFNTTIVTKDTHLYVTFFSKVHDKKLKDLSVIAKEGVEIVNLTQNEICCVVRLTPERNTTDMMGSLEKEFGKNITTRNWNTIKKLV